MLFKLRQFTLPVVSLIITVLLLAFAVSTSSSANVTSGGVSPAPGPHKLTVNKCSYADRHSFDQHQQWTRKLFKSYKIPEKAKQRHQHYVRCAKGPNHRKAMQIRWKKIKASLIEPLPANHDVWVRIGRCEQPGSGYKGINWSHGGPTYQGGLGIWYGNWTSLKPKSYPASAGQATWRQQMTVANRLAARYGFSAWGCY